jgi:membrane protein insertase Oxa1/YidC/SpoIIIJ
VFVYWVTSNTFTLVQTAATRVPAVRRALNLPLEQQVKVLTAASPGSGSEPVSPFQAAVSRAKQNATIQTHVNKPGKKKN